MRVYGFVGEKRSKSGAAEDILRALNGRFPQPLVNALLTGKADGIAGENAPYARLAFTTSLRAMVDAWINSAKTEEEEQPWKRTYWPLFLQDFVARNPPMLQIAKEGPCIVLFPHVWDKRKRLPLLAKEAIESMLSQLEDRESPSAQFMREITPFAFDAATAMFLQLLDSPACRRLFRCDGCGVYFPRVRTPKKDTPILNGSYCAKCKGKGSARRTGKSRDSRANQMIRWAADVWEEWKPNQPHSYGERAEWVAWKVNKRMPGVWSHIAKNWITRHTDEIEAEVRRRNHAKS